MGQILHDDILNSDVIFEDGADYLKPSVPERDEEHDEYWGKMNIDGTTYSLNIHYEQKPDEKSYKRGMWDTLDEYEKKAWSPQTKGFKTGFQRIDNAFDGGIKPGFIMIGGDSNIGKSALLTQMAWNISRYNGNSVYVMDFSLDDSMPDKLARVVAYNSSIPINAVKTPLLYTKYPLVMMRRRKGIADVRANINCYRAYDSAFTSFVEDIEEEVENKLVTFKMMQDDRQLVVCIDNFHDLDSKVKNFHSDKEKYDWLASWCSDLAIKYDIILICTAEIKKLNAPKRCSLDDLKEAVKIKYEAKAVMLVYNDVHYREDNAKIFYTDPNKRGKQPIFEVRFAKNKFHTYKGTIFMRFMPETATMIECSDKEQLDFRGLAYS